MANFNQSLFTTIIQNANSGFLIQKEDGSVVPVTDGAKGTIIQPQEAIKGMLFGDAPDKDVLTKELILALGGKLKSGPRTGAKRGRKPKNQAA